MKKIFWVISISALVLVVAQAALADDQKISGVRAAASSTYNSTTYPASKAVDNNTTTYWMGGQSLSPWWIRADARAVYLITKVVIKWQDASYAAGNYNIDISSNGTNWKNKYSGITGTFSTSGEVREIGENARYVRLYIYTTQGPLMPAIREFEIYKVVVPHLIRFQGNLSDAYGEPLEGTYKLTLKIYDCETGGTPLWTEVQQAVNVDKGFLDVLLGNVTKLDLKFDRQYWLGIEVESDGEMAPRFKLTTVPYSYTSEN